MVKKRTGHRWIETLIQQQPGKSKSGLAKAMGLTPPRVTEIIKGDRRIGATELSDIADYLGSTLDEVARMAKGGSAAGGEAEGINRVPIKGVVQAGVWREAIEEEYLGTITLPRIDEHEQLFALRVEGDSMDKVFPAGTLLICTPLGSYNHGLESGNYVIVHRRSAKGEWEATCKRIHEDDSKKRWLVPESNNPEYQAILVGENQAEEIQITAVVLWNIRKRTRY